MISHGWALMAASFSCSVAYQYIVFEYTAGDRTPPYGDWHRPLLLGVSVAASALAIWHAGTMLSAGRNEDAVISLIAASPAFILLSYVAQTAQAAQKGYSQDWRREVVHVYSGICLLLMAFTMASSAGYFVYGKLKGLKK